MIDKTVKKYSWWDYEKATKESGKSLAELFDFKSGLLIWRDTKDTPNKPLKPTTKGRGGLTQR